MKMRLQRFVTQQVEFEWYHLSQSSWAQVCKRFDPGISTILNRGRLPGVAFSQTNVGPEVPYLDGQNFDQVIPQNGGDCPTFVFESITCSFTA